MRHEKTFAAILFALAFFFFFQKSIDEAFAQSQSPTEEAAATFTLAAVGDIMLGTENHLPPDGASGFFTDVNPISRVGISFSGIWKVL
jgi:hypothetical protein